MRMAVGSDRVSAFTEVVMSYLGEKGIELVRCAAIAGRAVDYVDAAVEVALKVAEGQCDQGLGFCNTGTGVSIVANKVPGVRAALCVDPYSARIARLANNANVLILSMRYTGEGLAKEIIDSWLETQPATEGPRVAFHRKTDEVERLYRQRS